MFDLSGDKYYIEALKEIYPTTIEVFIMSEDTKQQTAKTKAKTVTLQNIGACLIRIDKVDVLPEKTVDVDESYVKSQAAKYHFFRKELEFYDDPKRTRELLEELKALVKKEPEKTIEELEKGKTIG